MILDIDKIAAEICYAGFQGRNIDYGGPKKYWKGVDEARKEAYRREARAAVAEIERQMKTTMKPSRSALSLPRVPEQDAPKSEESRDDDPAFHHPNG